LKNVTGEISVNIAFDFFFSQCRATHVPVGEDQLQHIQLAQHLARVFNNKYGPVFPRPSAVVYGKNI
jgi:tryptophanyl-tRNA synthetase